MPYHKNIYLSLGLCGLFTILMRLSFSGWLFLLGLLSSFVFGALHIIFLYQLNQRFDKLSLIGTKLAPIILITFPLIFLFQCDFGDSGGNFYTYEILLGDTDWPFENYAFYIHAIACIIYIICFVTWQIKSYSKPI